MVVHNYNLSIWEAEAGRSKVSGQSRLHSETLSQQNQRRKSSHCHLDAMVCVSAKREVMQF
jgi:hypothetical protein